MLHFTQFSNIQNLGLILDYLFVSLIFSYPVPETSCTTYIMNFSTWWMELLFILFQESSIFLAVLIRYSSRCVVLNPICTSEFPGEIFKNMVPEPHCRPIKLDSLGCGVSIAVVYSSANDFHGSWGWELLLQVNFRTVFQILKNKQKS